MLVYRVVFSVYLSILPTYNSLSNEYWLGSSVCESNWQTNAYTLETTH